jgi:hypothetical protein
MAWYQFSFSGQEASETPTARECHSLTLLNDTLWVFGGNDSASRMDTVYSLDTSEVARCARVAVPVSPRPYLTELVVRARPP